MPGPGDEEYDVFLSHRSEDKPIVEQLAEKLVEDERLNPFLDRWHLIPGEPWQESLEHALNQSRCVAVFVGPSGLGSWENEEMRAALARRAQQHRFRVIPVLLPGADRPARERLPSFLLRFTWVDFSAGIDDPLAFARLVAGIRGKAPGRSPIPKLSRGSVYVRKSVSEIIGELLRRDGIEVPPASQLIGATITQVIRQCQIMHPDVDPDEIACKIGNARAQAYEEKYSARCENEDERYRAFDEWEAELHALLRQIGVRDFAHGRAINVGLGNGLERPFFYREFQELVGVDLSGKALGEAARALPGLITLCASAERMAGAASNGFDLYLSLRTFQSSFFDIGEALLEAWRVLRSGGRAVVSVPYVYFDQGRLLTGLQRPGGQDLDPNLPYAIAERVRRGLQNLGFEQLGIRTGLFEIYTYGTKA